MITTPHLLGFTHYDLDHHGRRSLAQYCIVLQLHQRTQNPSQRREIKVRIYFFDLPSVAPAFALILTASSLGGRQTHSPS